MLIVLTGNDGAGKSTQIKYLIDHYKDLSMSVSSIHFPVYGHNQFSQLITSFLKGEFGQDPDPYFIANIYAMDRFMYKGELQKLIRDNDIVILDRYVICNVAFQCAKISDIKKRNELRDWILKFEYEFLKLPIPDLELFIDVPIDVIKERLSNTRIGNDREYLDGGKDIHEDDITLQMNVRDNYLDLSKKNNRFNVIETFTDRQLTPIEIFNKIKTLL